MGTDEDVVMTGFVCWCFYFLPVYFILHNQLSVCVSAELSLWGPTLSDVTVHLYDFVWVSLKNLGPLEQSLFDCFLLCHHNQSH